MKKVTKIFTIVVSAILILAPYYVTAEEETEQTPSSGETEITTPTPSENEITISINNKTLSLKVGDSKTLIATITPEDTPITWSSSNESVVKVEDGKVTALKAGTATITVKAGEKEATCTVTVEEEITEKSSTATLKSLKVNNGTLSPSFQSGVYEYSVSVDDDITSLELSYELSDSKATMFKPTNNSNLKNGDTLEIKVIAEDGTTNHTYTLTIIKSITSLNLKSLKITGYALNESFDANTLKYTASIPYEVETITVQAAAEDSDAKVSVSGVSNLKVGANIVTITVTDAEGNAKKYQITVTRETKVSVTENPTSIITSSNSDDTQTSSSSNIVGIANSDDDMLKYVIVSLACLILIAIGGIGIYFYLKTSPRKLRKALKVSKEESPIVEVSNQDEIKKQETIEKMLQDDLVQTKEFEINQSKNKQETENLFDDQDV